MNQQQKYRRLKKMMSRNNKMMSSLISDPEKNTLIEESKRIGSNEVIR